jgi:3-phenylpropionate/trans-cinnamate dioxygenase ferredoxin reductase subunit
MMPENIVIVGAGQAAAQAIEILRRRGFGGRITLVGDEPWLPYQRPPLSKKYLAGEMERERLFVRPAEYYRTHAVDLRLGRRVEDISRSEQCVALDDGSRVSYDSLLLATGCRPRALAVAGANLQGVFSIRNIADVERMREYIAPGKRLVIVGGGYIGLELAATLSGLGLEVTILELADRVMGRVVDPVVSEFFAREHAQRGVRIICNARVRELHASPGSCTVGAVITEDGARYSADLVVVGVGVVPADELAASAGLECERGIQVDDRCRTSDAMIFAAGDCASHPSARFGCRLRLESVDNAVEQGTSAALNMLGLDTVHDKVPWFWSDQYDLKLLIAGINQGHDTVVVRGEPAARAFSVCYLQKGELLAIDTVNRPQDHIVGKKLIAARARPDLNKLADVRVPLRETC